MIERIVAELELDEGLVAAAADRLRRPPTDPLAAIVEPYGALVAAVCASGDHEAEARLASALMDATEGIGPRRTRPGMAAGRRCRQSPGR